MATNFFTCENCKYSDTIEAFENNEYFCPRCQSEDIFPERIYRCDKCGSEGTQNEFFDLDSYDLDPLELGHEGVCRARFESSDGYEECGSRNIVQIK